jgi:(S)-mandelate dehydrogenase
VILSNHGGRQLDAAVSPLDVLADTRARISAPILIDSGYRRGTDIVKALALGANAVLLGRASLYGLAAAGQAGVDHVLRLLKDEVDRTLAQIGCPSVAQLSPDYAIADGSMPTASPSVRSLAKVS